MRIPRLLALLLAIALCSCATSPGLAMGEEDRVWTDIIHSNLPLFRDAAENMWPRPVSDDRSFGCVSRVVFGDWVLLDRDGYESRWYRFQHYGAFHCWAVMGETEDRQQLEAAMTEAAFFVFVESVEIDGDLQELWVLQIGATPGSEYLLLSRSPREGPIDAFDVLQSRCPSANVRDAGPLDGLLTRYCALNSRSDLMRVMRRMAQAPARGTLTVAPRDHSDE